MLEKIKGIVRKSKQLNERKEIDIDVNNGCKEYNDEFYCIYAGTECCVKESCNDCKLNNCRGCTFLQECIREGAI